MGRRSQAWEGGGEPRSQQRDGLNPQVQPMQEEASPEDQVEMHRMEPGPGVE